LPPEGAFSPILRMGYASSEHYTRSHTWSSLRRLGNGLLMGRKDRYRRGQADGVLFSKILRMGYASSEHYTRSHTWSSLRRLGNGLLMGSERPVPPGRAGLSALGGRCGRWVLWVQIPENAHRAQYKAQESGTGEKSVLLTGIPIPGTCGVLGAASWRNPKDGPVNPKDGPILSWD
jgi:hypothetical protein